MCSLWLLLGVALSAKALGVGNCFIHCSRDHGPQSDRAFWPHPYSAAGLQVRPSEVALATETRDFELSSMPEKRFRSR